MGQLETVLCSCLRALNTFRVFSDESATSLNVFPWQCRVRPGSAVGTQERSDVKKDAPHGAWRSPRIWLCWAGLRCGSGTCS